MTPTEMMAEIDRLKDALAVAQRESADWRRHCKKAEANLAEQTAGLDGVTVKEVRRLRALEDHVNGRST